MKKIQQILLEKKALLITIAFVVVLLASPLLVGEASAQIDQIRDGVGATGDAPEGVSVEGTVASAIRIISYIIGIISVIMIIIGGLNDITSTGDSGKVESAKNTIIYAVIGLVIVALAQLIVVFVLDRTVGTEENGEEESSMAPSLVIKQDFDQIT